MALSQGFVGWFVLLPLLACLARGVNARSLLQAKAETCRLGGTGLSVDNDHPSLAVFNLFFSANCPLSGVNGSACNVTGFLPGSTVTVNSTVYNVTAGLGSYGGPDNLVYPGGNNSVDESGLSFGTSNGTTFLLSYSSQDNKYLLQRSGTALPNSFSLASVDFTCASAAPATSERQSCQLQRCRLLQQVLAACWGVRSADKAHRSASWLHMARAHAADSTQALSRCASAQWLTCLLLSDPAGVCVLTLNQPMQASRAFQIPHTSPVIGMAASISLSFGAYCPYGSANGFPCFVSRYLLNSSLTVNVSISQPLDFGVQGGVNVTVSELFGPLDVTAGAPFSGLMQFSPDFAVFPGGNTAVDGFGLGFFTGLGDEFAWDLYFLPSQYYLATNYEQFANYPYNLSAYNVLPLVNTSVDLRCSPPPLPEPSTCLITAQSSGHSGGKYDETETLDLYLFFSVACPLGVDNGCNVVSFLPGSQVVCNSIAFDVTGLGSLQDPLGFFVNPFGGLDDLSKGVQVDNVVYPNGVASNSIDAPGTYFLDSYGLAFNTTSNGTVWLYAEYGTYSLRTNIPDPQEWYLLAPPDTPPAKFSMTCELPSARPTTETCRLGGAGASYFGETIQNTISAFFNLFLSASCAYGSVAGGFPCNVTAFLPGSTVTLNGTVYKVTAGLGSYGGPDNLVFPGRNKVVDYDGLSFSTSHGDTFLLFYSSDYGGYLVRSDKYGPLDEVPLYEFTDVYFSCASAPPESGTCVLTGHGKTAHDNAVNMALSFATYCPYGSANGFPCNVTEYLPGSNVTFNGKVYSITPGLGTVHSSDNNIYVSGNTTVDFTGISFTAADGTSFNFYYDVFFYYLQSDSLSATFTMLHLTCTLSSSVDTNLQPCGFAQAYNSGGYYGPTVSRSIALNSEGGVRIQESLTIRGKHFIISLDYGPAAGVLVANKTKFQFGFFADLASADASTSAACNPSADGALWYYVKYGDPVAISTLPAGSSVNFTSTTITITLPIQQAAYPFLNVPLHALCDQGKLGGAQLLLRAYNTDKLNTTAPPGQCNDDISLAGNYLPFFLTCYCGSA